MTNINNIKFEYSPEELELFSSDQREFLNRIEIYYAEIKKKCRDNIKIVITGTHKEWITARVNLHVNTSLIRLLYLTESFCDASNKFNSVAVASHLKSMVEIPMHLGYLVWIISEHKKFEEIKTELSKIAFGKRNPKNNLTYKAKITQKEFYKTADLMLKKIFHESPEDVNVLETIYQEANATGHHNYEGRNVLTGFQNGDETGGTWKQKNRKEWFIFISGNIFQFFLYATTILSTTKVLEEAIEHYLNQLPETLE